MILDKLIADLQEIRKEEGGDIEVTMTGTLLQEGFCKQLGYVDKTSGIQDVFESTVDTLMVIDTPFAGEDKVKRLKLFWQT